MVKSSAERLEIKVQCLKGIERKGSEATVWCSIAY
jgi:hypothetical protein